MTDLGYLSRKTAGSRAQLITMPISVSLLEGAGDLLGLTEKGDIWYLHLRVALSGFEKRFGCISLGPKTPTRTLFLPISI